jgi:Fe-S-cluster containining protein
VCGPPFGGPSRSERPITPTDLPADTSALCQSCGACCAYSKEWPRFSTEDDADLARIPPAFVDDGQNRMRCNGDRCTALRGEVGVATACAVYAVRPEVCRTCLPGDDACTLARLRFGLPPIIAG